MSASRSILGVAGAVAIYNTKDGQVQGNDTPEVQFPVTPTGAIAVLGADGALASLAVVTVRPTEDGEEPGTGGTVVPVPVSADVSGGIGTERLPLDETVGLFGAESLVDEVPALLGVSIDDVAPVTEAELASALRRARDDRRDVAGSRDRDGRVAPRRGRAAGHRPRNSGGDPRSP